MENMFEYATRNKLRFDSQIGVLAVEDLWDLPLTDSRKAATLDNIAKEINRDLKEETEESFVVKSTNRRKKTLEVKLDIVKHIIGVKMAEAEASKRRVENKKERERLLEILAQKEDESLKSQSVDDIRKRLAELDA